MLFTPRIERHFLITFPCLRAIISPIALELIPTLALTKMLCKHANLYAYDGVRIEGFAKKSLKLGYPVPRWVGGLGADLF